MSAPTLRHPGWAAQGNTTPHPPSITQRWPTSSRITPHYPTHYPGLLGLISAIQVHYITEDGRRVSWVRFSLIANYSLKWKVPEVAVFTKCHTIDKSNIMLWLVPAYFLFLLQQYLLKFFTLKYRNWKERWSIRSSRQGLQLITGSLPLTCFSMNF